MATVLGKRNDNGLLPSNIRSMMEAFGRFEFDPHTSGVSASIVWDQLQAPVLAFAISDPAGFVAALADVLLPGGGWAAYGAVRTISSLIKPNYDHPGYDALRAASLQFLRESGVPDSRLSSNERTFWNRTRGQTEPWLIGRPTPTPEQAPITDLQPGEVRLIARLFPDADSNLILVDRIDGQGYRLIVDARQSDDDPRRSRREAYRADTLYELYARIGQDFQSPTYWAHRELEPYFPVDRPKI